MKTDTKELYVSPEISMMKVNIEKGFASSYENNQYEDGNPFSWD